MIPDEIDGDATESSTFKENDGDRLTDASVNFEHGDNNDELPDEDIPQQHGRPLHPPRPLFDNMNQFRTPPPFGNMQHQQQQPPFVRPLLMTPNFRNQNQSPNQQGGGPRFWGGNQGNNQHNQHNQHNQQSPPVKPWERSIRPNTFDMNTPKKATSVEEVVPGLDDTAPGTSSPPRVVVNPFKQQPAASDTSEPSPAVASPAIQTPVTPTTPNPTTTPKRVNPFSQQPRFAVSDVENNSLLMTQRGGGPRGSWQPPQVRPNFEPQQPEMNAANMFSPGGGPRGGGGPMFQQPGGINPMGFPSPMMRGGGRGGRGGSPYFRQQGPRMSGIGGMGAGNNQRPMFRNNFRGNPRGGGMW